MMIGERLLGLIYEGVTNEEAWSGLLARLGDRIGAAGTGPGVQDMATQAFWAIAESGSTRRFTGHTPVLPRETGFGGKLAFRPVHGRLDGDAKFAPTSAPRVTPRNP